MASDDIVIRLREQSDDDSSPETLCLYAADEIERLRLTDEERAAITEAADAYDDGCNERCREVTKLLRGLLERTK